VSRRYRLLSSFFFFFFILGELLLLSFNLIHEKRFRLADLGSSNRSMNSPLLNSRVFAIALKTFDVLT